MPRRMLSTLVATALLLGVFGDAGGVPGRASCASPEVSFSPRQLVAGGEAAIRGRYWANGCDDTVECVQGCGRTACDPIEPAEPAGPVTIRIRPVVGGDPWIVLAENVMVGSNLGFRITIDVPSELPSGRYVVDARSADGIEGYGADIRVVKSSPTV